MKRNDRGAFSLWQLALYIAVLGVVSMLLAPLTALWWIVPLLGAAVPVLLAVIQARERQGVTAANAPAAAQVTKPPYEDDHAPLEHAEIPEPGTGAPASATRLFAPDLGLSERELEVLAQLATGQKNAEVAKALYISVGTVKSHSANIYRKLEAKNRTEAVARARELGVLP